MSFVVHHDKREKLAEELRSRGVDTTTGYMNDMSDHPLFQEYRMSVQMRQKPIVNFFILPVHPNLSPRDVEHMIHAVRSACAAI